MNYNKLKEVFKDKIYHEFQRYILNKYKESVGEDGYKETQDAYESDKENLNNVYDTYKPYIEKGKEKAKSSYEKAKEKVSSWYQEYKESSD